MRPKMKRLGGPLLGLILAATLGARPASAWQYTLNGNSAMDSQSPIDAAYSVVVDSGGDIIAGGNIGVNPLLADGLVVKLSGRLGAPSVLWQTRFTSDYPFPANSINRVALDGDGNVLVAGRWGGMDESYNISFSVLVAKLNGATGAVLWEQHISFNPSDSLANGVALALDSAGNVIAGGQADPDGDGWNPNSAVVKLDGGTGAVLWQVTGPNQAGMAVPVTSVAVDHAGNVLVGGEQGGSAVWKYDGATGAELWVSLDVAGGWQTFRAIAVDASDNIVAVGTTNGMVPGVLPFLVRKLDTNGTTLWDSNQGTSSDSMGAFAVILDDVGNVFATGQAFGIPATFKLNGATGAVVWQQSLEGGKPGFDYGEALALDPSGDPVVGGKFTVGRFTMGILKLDATTGSQLWSTFVDGAGADNIDGQGGQQAYAVAVDPRGDVVAAGVLNPVTGNYGDFAVVKRNGAGGTDFVQLCGNGVIEGTETCDDGNTAAGDGCGATCQTEAGFLCLGEPSSCVVPVGVSPKKLLVLDKLAASGTAKTVFAAKDKNVSKGLGTDPTAISATFTAVYANGSARGGFTIPAGAGWLVNTAKVAKYVNKTAPAGPTQTKVALIRPESTLSLTAKGIGDTPFDILAAGDPAGDVNTAYCVTNGSSTICHCSVNQNCVFTKVAGDTGAKLVCKGGAADPTCAALLP